MDRCRTALGGAPQRHHASRTITPRCRRAAASELRSPLHPKVPCQPGVGVHLPGGPALRSLWCRTGWQPARGGATQVTAVQERTPTAPGPQTSSLETVVCVPWRTCARQALTLLLVSLTNRPWQAWARCTEASRMKTRCSTTCKTGTRRMRHCMNASESTGHKGRRTELTPSKSSGQLQGGQPSSN